MNAAQEQLSLIFSGNNQITVIYKIFSTILVWKSVAKLNLETQRGFFIRTLSIV